jgi:hypothetical protein
MQWGRSRPLAERAERADIQTMDIASTITVCAIITLLVFLVWQIVPQKQADSRRAANRCAQCGYDLRASADRCPECGAAILTPLTADEEETGLADDLLASAPIEPRKPGADERMVPACYTSNALEAGFLARVLEHRGITSLVEGQPRPTDYQPPRMRVMVWSDDEEPAKALVEEIGRRQADRNARRG